MGEAEGGTTVGAELRVGELVGNNVGDADAKGVGFSVGEADGDSVVYWMYISSPQTPQVSGQCS